MSMDNFQPLRVNFKSFRGFSFIQDDFMLQKNKMKSRIGRNGIQLRKMSILYWIVHLAKRGTSKLRINYARSQRGDLSSQKPFF
jgi:hypothetical protein